MKDPKVLKGSAYVLLIIAIGMIATALFRDGNNMWLALAGALVAFGATTLFVKADPERYRKSKASEASSRSLGSTLSR